MYLASKILDFFFPRACILCGTTGAYLCKTCKKFLQPHPEICPVCHRFSQDCQKCLNCKSDKNFVVEGIIIPFRYDSLLKKLIMKLKYFHKKDIGGFLIDRLTLALEANETFQKEFHICPPFVKEGWCEAPEDLVVGHKIPHPQNADTSPLSTNVGFLKGRQNSKLVISFVPTHRYRQYFVKGYNQSQLLAKKLSEKLQVPLVDIAKKKKHTKTQASLDRNGRLKNLKNAFSLIPNLTLLGNETILIVDDITTTGSTINELAKLIKFYYPNIKVRGAVLGRHM